MIAEPVKQDSQMGLPGYRADLTAGSLKLAESRIIADLLLSGATKEAWNNALFVENRLQVKNRATAVRLGRLIRDRLSLMKPEFWNLVRDGSVTVTSHALLAAAIKHSRLLGDFFDITIRDQYRLFSSELSPGLWHDFLAECRRRDPEMPVWNESTIRRMKSSVFQVLAQAGFIESTRSPKLRRVHIAPEVIRYLQEHEETYVLRCITVGS
ncbi:MAG: DUF1819 family protein [Limisphaerales bacterium]